MNMSKISANRVCLIGLGIITQRYRTGLSQSEFFNLCAVADLNEAAPGRAFYQELPFYTDYQKMIDEQKPDYVIIATPPQTHFEVATRCLEKGVHVVIEKPVTLCLEQFDALLALAQSQSLVLRTLFHWHGGIETQAFTRQYDPTQIREIQVSVCDPYCSDGSTIDPDRRPLMGAWIDSGVNILSMLRLWLPLESCRILSTDCQRCQKTNLPVYAKAELLLDGVKTLITVDWRQGINHKESYVTLEDQTVHINHSAQSICAGGTVTDYARLPRLDEHYLSLFQTIDGSSNGDFSRSVHKILFQVNEAL